MAVVTMRELLDSGVHFGHQTRRWNPKMRRFIFTERNGIYIIDLQQTLTYIDEAFEFVKETVAHGGTILYVGTKKQAQEPIQEEAMESEGGFEGRTKKEILMLTRERTKLERVLGGIAEMHKVPSALWVVDTNKEHIAVNEAHKLNIPVVAILDTNCDPDVVNYPVPGNDDAIRSIAVLTRVISAAVIEGKKAREERALAAAKDAAGDSQREEAVEVAAKVEAPAEVAAKVEAPAEVAAKVEAPAEVAAEAKAAEDKATPAE